MENKKLLIKCLTYFYLQYKPYYGVASRITDYMLIILKCQLYPIK